MLGARDVGEKTEYVYLESTTSWGEEEDQNTELSSPSESETTDVVETPQEHPPRDHQKRISSGATNNESEATDELVLQDRNK